MKIINPSVEIMRNGLEKEVIIPEQFIEKVGRTCYKSEDKITEDSAAKFVSNLIKRGHEAMIEHWSLIFTTDAGWYEEIKADWDMLMHDCQIPLNERLRPYLRFTDWQNHAGMRCVISGNMRAWRDYAKACVEGFGFIPTYMFGLIRNYPLFFPEYQSWVPETIVNYILKPITAADLISDVERDVHMDVTVKFICDRGVSHELVRHRTASFAQESTRYCNYSLGKFGGEITVINPAQFIEYGVECTTSNPAYMAWYDCCNRAGLYYQKMIEAGCSPQEARAVLPNSLKTEVIMTANMNNWKHFFNLRCAKDAHPDMQVVAKMARLLFTEFAKEDE